MPDKVPRGCSSEVLNQLRTDPAILWCCQQVAGELSVLWMWEWMFHVLIS